MAKIGPDSPLAAAAARMTMAASLPTLLRSEDRVSRALREALRVTALGPLPPAERAWGARIEARRRAIPNLISAADRGGRDEAEHLAEATRACRWMSLPPVWGRLLMRLVRELKPACCLELGTGFGIATAYQAAALELNGGGEIVGLDVERMTGIAHDTLTALELESHADLIGGMIEDTLERALTRSAPVELALLDADHTEHGTLAHLEAILPHLAADAVVVLDDIRWTDEMRRAWRAVEHHEGVSATIGLRRVGIAVISSHT